MVCSKEGQQRRVGKGTEGPKGPVDGETEEQGRIEGRKREEGAGEGVGMREKWGTGRARSRRRDVPRRGG